MMNKVHFSSVTGEWETPQYFFDKYDAQYHFVLDACATPNNAKCKNYFTKKDDALTQNWERYGVIWCNPPYGREISKWVQKAYEESRKGLTIVCLLPARTDTSWFHDYCKKGKVEFVRGRLKFGGSKNSAPFPSMIVVFGGRS